MYRFTLIRPFCPFCALCPIRPSLSLLPLLSVMSVSGLYCNGMVTVSDVWLT